MAETVFLLCALTSLGCAILLFRGYRRSRSRLLFWSCACFFCMAISNILLFVDLVVIPGFNLQLVRNCFTLAGLSMLLYGMILDTV